MRTRRSKKPNIRRQIILSVITAMAWERTKSDRCDAEPYFLNRSMQEPLAEHETASIIRELPSSLDLTKSTTIFCLFSFSSFGVRISLNECLLECPWWPLTLVEKNPIQAKEAIHSSAAKYRTYDGHF